MFTYRNRHNGMTYRFASPMLADTLYADDADGVFRVTFGVEGRDGMFFDPQHWQIVDE